MSELRIVGKIFGFHGLKGEIKVYPLIDDLSFFESVDELFIDAKNYTIENSRLHKNAVLLKLKDYNSLSAVEKFSGYVSAFVDHVLADSEVYIEDLKHMLVINDFNEEIGFVENFYDSNQQLIGIKANERLNCKREILLPFVDEFILEINKKDRYIKVKLDAGILELAQ